MRSFLDDLSCTVRMEIRMTNQESAVAFCDRVFMDFRASLFRWVAKRQQFLITEFSRQHLPERSANFNAASLNCRFPLFSPNVNKRECTRTRFPAQFTPRIDCWLPGGRRFCTPKSLLQRSCGEIVCIDADHWRVPNVIWSHVAVS